MDVNSFRILARVLGYLESICTIGELYSDSRRIFAITPSASVGIICAILVVRLFSILVVIWATSKLGDGTRRGLEATVALRLCKTWRTVIVSIAVFELLLQFNAERLMRRILTICTVHAFIMELEKVQIPLSPRPDSPEFQEFPREMPPAEE